MGSTKSSKNVQDVLLKLHEQNLEPVYNKIEENLTEQEALNKEVEWIKYYGRDNLCNESDGGVGGDLITNHPNKEQILLKMRKPKSEQGKKNMRKKRSLEHRKNISIATSGKNNPMFGKRFYDIWIEKYGKKEADKKENERKNKLKIYRTGKHFNKKLEKING